MKPCHSCDNPAIAPETVSTFESVPYKQNGWIGDQFIPYDRKFKTPIERKQTLCGLCAAIHYQKDYEGRTDVDAEELREELLALAHNEIEARHDYEAERRASTTIPDAPKPEDTDSIAQYLARLVYKPKRDYATKYAAYVRNGREGKEPKPKGLSAKVADKVTTKLNKLARAS